MFRSLHYYWRLGAQKLTILTPHITKNLVIHIKIKGYFQLTHKISMNKENRNTVPQKLII